jgi:ketosteroid isomerase-like protein
MDRRLTTASIATLLLAGCATSPAPDLKALTEQVRAAETAFAQSMADRRFDTFGSFVADDAVFINGGQPLRGKTAVLLFWQRFFERADAPFAWKPEIVEVLATGRLAYSEGPVSGPDGKVFARYFSTWRREADGRWLVVLDNGYSVRDADKAEKKP